MRFRVATFCRSAKLEQSGILTLCFCGEEYNEIIGIRGFWFVSAQLIAIILAGADGYRRVSLSAAINLSPTLRLSNPVADTPPSG